MLNPRLAGYIRRNGWIVERLRGDPILDPTIGQQVMQWHEARGGRPFTGAQLCSGQRAVVCGNCGNTLKGSVDTGCKVIHYEDGKPTRRYCCSKDNGGCGRIIADQRVLDKHVKAIVIKVLSDPEHMDQIKRRAQQEAKARAPIEAEIARLEGLRAF
ncbi:hypothetical protein [Streptantibioticus ferralitis]|uniref:Recombinase zinc beta ribbon domain-containing protein n=1 Tax=Streptantibioticus ferralitis TaxID=236510 RepID=A0ABT5YWR7_9ACTN|nr:hypothetical protein [Streptantibioticus ferralitis]MDF2256047.1 hypothetical protein [Streptantibioticus ferralitis]